MQTAFFARRGVALSIVLGLVGAMSVGVIVWRTRSVPAADRAPVAGAPSNDATPLDPAQVHEQWVVALRDGNRPQALRLYTPGDLHDAAVDNQMEHMDSKLHSPSSTLGQLVRVSPEAPAVDGARARGTSRWVFGNGATLCFEAKLNRDDAGSRFVTDYGAIPCT